MRLLLDRDATRLAFGRRDLEAHHGRSSTQVRFVLCLLLGVLVANRGPRGPSLRRFSSGGLLAIGFVTEAPV